MEFIALPPDRLNRSFLTIVFFASALSWALYGCLDKLPEGSYACSEEGRNSGCPRGWYCRTGDAGMNELRCYSSPGSDVVDDVNGSDDGGESDDDSGTSQDSGRKNASDAAEVSSEDDVGVPD